MLSDLGHRSANWLSLVVLSLLMLAANCKANEKNEKKQVNFQRDITNQLSTDADVDAIAGHLLKARKTSSITRSLALHFPDLDRAKAYQIQMALLKKIEAQGNKLVGWKMGGTKIAKLGQKLDPIFGFMLASDERTSGSTVRSILFADDTPIIEAELGFRIARDLPGPQVSREELEAAIAGVGGACELISVRVRDALGGLEAGVNRAVTRRVYSSQATCPSGRGTFRYGIRPSCHQRPRGS